MRRRQSHWLCLWVMGALVACATTRPLELESAPDADEGDALSFEEACAQGSSLLAMCDGSQCGLYRCREVMEHVFVRSVVLTRGGLLPLLGSQAGAQRHWGSAQELPQDTRPVFIIPWGYKPPLLPSQTAMLEEAAKERRKPHEKHHIFPQAFKEWFGKQGIPVDEYVIPLEVEKHRSIHRGERGGPWNEAWRKFINPRLAGAPKEEIYRYAGQLIYEFQLFGPVIPYWKQPPLLPTAY